MKLTDLTYIPPITPSPQPTVPGNSVPLTSGNGQQTADSSKIVYGSNAGNGGGIEYPTASNEKIGASELSGATKAGGGRRGGGSSGHGGSGSGPNPGSNPLPNGQGGSNPLPNGQGGSNPLPNGQGGSNPLPNGQGGSNPLPNGQGGSNPPPNGQGGPNSHANGSGGSNPRSNKQGGSHPLPNPKAASPGIKDSLKTTQNINDLHDKNGFPPLSSELASSARNSLISGGVNLLVNIPLNVGEHLASKAIIDRIEAQAAMPGAAKKNADGTTTTVDPAATEKQKIDARLEDSEIKTELMVNQILSINEGSEANAVSKKSDAPKDTAGRLTNQEKTMDGIEAQLQDLGTRYDLVYKPYEAPKSSDAPTDKSRMDAIELRHKHMNRMIKRLITLVESDVT
ncbi:conserved hypothetical protein [Pseudomonas veronii]|nr:conserved hypothetical protein [Pseudomonas veronii]SEB60599.1 hypothetical protein SAMN04490199_1918 [Pseudomonas marginalis]